MLKYQWEVCAKQEKAKLNLSKYTPQFGPVVTARNKHGKATKARFRIYLNRSNADAELQINDEKLLKLENENNGFFSVEADVEHGQTYVFINAGVKRCDPAASFFDKQGRSVFWDFDDPDFKSQQTQLDLLNRSVRILQTDIFGLACHFADQEGKLGKDIPLDQTFSFITESGVIKKIKELGFNTIQFLPFNQSITGGKWSFRYLIPFLHAIDNKFGTPADMKAMIEAFHKEGIAVVADFVISHVPFRDYEIFGKTQDEVGLHHWKGDYDEEIWFGEETSWGTRRYNYGNKTVRDFIIEAALKMMKYYGIDGLRIDNVDGIMRHGENGDGEPRTGGRELLRELNKAIYDYSPHAYVHLESHFFKDGEAKYLTLPLKAHRKAIGATAYTSSRLTHYFHRDYMPKAADEISPWKMRDIMEEKEWGQSNSTVADFHNHDAAAGLMYGRATGSYAYDALILQKPELHHHAIGKIKVMEAIISFGCEGRTLDLLQSHLLQTGTFEHDSTIHWFLDMVPASKAMLSYKQKVNKIMDNPALWPLHTDKRLYANVDDITKSLVIFRADSHNDPKNQLVIYVNLASHMLFDYVIPVKDAGNYEVLLNSDDLQFAGDGRIYYPSSLASENVDLFEYYQQGIRLDAVAPYQVLVLKRSNQA